MQVEAVVAHIENWLKTYCTDAGLKGFIVGVSGGIDSAVTSALCARTGLPTTVCDLPIYQSSDQVSRGQTHMESLKRQYPNVCIEQVELTSTFDTLVNSLPHSEDDSNREMSLVNARARLRMTTLYYFAALDNKLVVGTGNKVEDFGVGFYTKYGDGGVDISPIADLMKTEVYELGRALGIGEEILKAQPTDGLWGDDRTDEDQIGASYPELEWAMLFDGDESKISERQKEVLKIYRRLHKITKHKMVPIPVCEIPESLKA